jgi:GxxExxY protein
MMIMMNADNFKHANVTEAVIKAFYNVYNVLGYGFLEKVYERALTHEIKKFNLKVIAQYPLEVFYDNQKMGHYFADLLVEDVLIVELKAAEYLVPENEAQLINYLKASRLEVGLLLNFGKTPQFKRRVFTNDRKSARII